MADAQGLPKSAFGWSAALHTTFLEFVSTSRAGYKIGAKEEALWIRDKLGSTRQVWEHRGSEQEQKNQTIQ